jgi:hypothetical protein
MGEEGGGRATAVPAAAQGENSDESRVCTNMMLSSKCNKKCQTNGFLVTKCPGISVVTPYQVATPEKSNG